MRRGPVVVACREPQAGRLASALEAAGLPVERLAPESADPGTVEGLAPRVLVLEVDPKDTADRIQAFWEGREMDEHLPILLLHSPGDALMPEGILDEPVDRIAGPADPREVVARVEGLVRSSLIRIYRSTFHELSQPLTIARAVAQKTMKLCAPSDPLRPSLVELDRQVERLFRIAEELQRKRTE